MLKRKDVRLFIILFVLALSLYPLRYALEFLEYGGDPNNITPVPKGTLRCVYLDDYYSAAKDTVGEKVEIIGDKTIGFGGRTWRITQDKLPYVKDYSSGFSAYGPSEVEIAVQSGKARCLNKTVPFTFPQQEKRYLATLYRMPLWIQIVVKSDEAFARMMAAGVKAHYMEEVSYWGKVVVDKLVVRLSTRLENVWFVTAVFAEINKYLSWSGSSNPKYLEVTDENGDGINELVQKSSSWWYKVYQLGQVYAYFTVNGTVPATRRGKPIEYPRDPMKFETLWKMDGIELTLSNLGFAPPAAEIDFKTGTLGLGQTKVRAWGVAVFFARIDVYFAWLIEAQEGEDYGGESPEDIYANIADFVPAVIDTYVPPIEGLDDPWGYLILGVLVLIAVFIIVGVLIFFLMRPTVVVAR